MSLFELVNQLRSKRFKRGKINARLNSGSMRLFGLRRCNAGHPNRFENSENWSVHPEKVRCDPAGDMKTNVVKDLGMNRSLVFANGL